MISFECQMQEQPYRAERAIAAMQEMSAAARLHGISELSLEEINEEIAAARKAGSCQE